MAYIKTQEEIDKILEGGQILGRILEHLTTLVKPGVTGLDIDKEAERMIREAGGRPAFKGYKSRKHDPEFPSTICFSLNDEIVHGIATQEKVIQDGDLVSIDIGMQYPAQGGYFTDTAVTVAVGDVPEHIKQLLAVTQKSLYLGIKQAQSGNLVSDIGKEIENYIKPQGYGIVRDLVGHGVGHDVHEDPRVPNYFDQELSQWTLEPGVVIAIEPMITCGTHEVATAEDGWGIISKDGSLSAHFEHTVVISKDGPIMATLRPSEKKQ